MADNNRSTAPTPPRGGPGGGGPGPRGVIAKPKNFKKSFISFVKELRKYWLQMVIIILAAAGSSIFSIIGPKILAKITDSVSTSLIDGNPFDYKYISSIMVTLIVFYLISAATSCLQGLLMASVTVDLSINLRAKLAKKTFNVSLKDLDGMSTGNLLSIITNDINTVAQYLNQGVSQLVTSIATMVGIVIMMITISIPMTIVVLLTLPISFLLVTFIMKRSQKYFKRQSRTLGNITGQAEEVYTGQKLVFTYDKSKDEIVKFNNENEKLYDCSWKAQMFSGMMFPIIGFIGNLGYVGVVFVGTLLAINGSVSLGDIQAFIQYVRSFNQPMSQTAQISAIWQTLIASWERIFEFINHPDEVYQEGNLLADKINGAVEFDHVKFGYNENKLIINDFNTKIAPGQKIAIVGPTGAGKTTVVKLLMRFYEINGGSIIIDNVDYKEYNRESLRNEFGMVLQDAWLFEGSIKENIVYSNSEATNKEYEDALKASNLKEFVKTLPGGSNFILNEDASNVSQGQRQLITIARTIMSNPRLLILDEATSSVDTRTEVLIQKAMQELTKGRTTFIIAHRLSTIRNADLILVMNHGDIIEQGKHSELIKDPNSFYAKLYYSQFEE